MYPGMLFLILSRDEDFVAAMKALIESKQGRVYWVTSEEEAEFEMVVWDAYRGTNGKGACGINKVPNSLN